MKQLLKASIMFITSLVLFTAVVYAWFVNFDEAHVQPISATLTDGSPIPYEIKYYTKDHVYKYDVATKSVLVYDEATATYVPQRAFPIDIPAFSFSNMFTHEYDPVIEENNFDKNVIAEITMNFTGDAVTLRSKILSDISLANQAVSSYPYQTSRPYYLTEALRVQSMISKDFNGFSEGSNKFTSLNTAFNSVDVNQNLIYGMYSFYENDTYTGVVDFGNILLTNDVTSYKLYYNFTYDDTKINELLAYENMDVVVDNMNVMVFFPDIKFNIVLGGNS